ncbi:unnamed protein product [Closterium sp. Naga37s-1]|nr:unnamed protein product [Closterium sp. Naga37s-1]
MCATSATRRAANAADLLIPAAQVIGSTPEIISGEEEGKLTFLGATAAVSSVLAGVVTGAPLAVIDIGGGSSEVALGTISPPFRDEVSSSFYLSSYSPTISGPHTIASIDIGSSSLSHSYSLHLNPTSPSSIEAARRAAREDYRCKLSPALSTDWFKHIDQAMADPTAPAPGVSALDFLTRGKPIAPVAPPTASTSAAVPTPIDDAPLSSNGRYKQRVLNFARPGGPTQPAPSVETRPVAPEPAAKDFEDPKGKKQSVEELQLKCKEQWQRYFPWLFISETKDGRPCMRCSVCMVFADPHSKYGRYGVGGTDIQKQTMRKHHHSLKHEAAVLRKEQRDGAKKGQKSIVDFHQGDEDVKRLARLMSIVLFICKSDAPIVLFVSLVQFMAEQGTPDLPLKENRTYYSE